MGKSEVKYCVDFGGPIAVFVQIENQVQFAIASGKYKTGDTLPSVREMSSMLNVNPNTITKAYRDLEVMKILYTRRGVGVMVADRADKICRASILGMVKRHLRDAVAECIASGISAEELQKLVAGTIGAGCLPYQPD